MKKWYQILWGSKEERDLEEKIANKVVDSINLKQHEIATPDPCLLYTSPSPRDRQKSRMPSSA